MITQSDEIITVIPACLVRCQAVSTSLSGMLLGLGLGTKAVRVTKSDSGFLFMFQTGLKAFLNVFSWFHLQMKSRVLRRAMIEFK